LQYLLRWKGYSATHDSWEATAETNCPDLVQEFYAANPTAIRRAHHSYINPSKIDYTDIPSSPMNPHHDTMETQSSPGYQSQDSNETGLALCQSTLDDQSTELAYYNQQDYNDEEEYYNEDHRCAVCKEKQRQIIPPYYQQLERADPPMS
jgi:Chromo (CHRromatin Organisation MOdifier) domain